MIVLNNKKEIPHCKSNYFSILKYKIGSCLKSPFTNKSDLIPAA